MKYALRRETSVVNRDNATYVACLSVFVSIVINVHTYMREISRSVP